ncbi:MAG: hypothetical protein EOL87_07360 [Spartobacteria bacterium]|nr:hypothetical protein [Spartobacteria bacterium]
MTQKRDKPDVERIVETIKSQLKHAETAVPPTESSDTHSNVYTLLQQANESYALQVPAGGNAWKQRVRKGLLTLLSPVTDRIIDHNAHVVRVLNKLVKVLDGSDDELKGELLTATRNRMDLIESLADRVIALEKQVADLQQSSRREPPA